MVDLRPRGADEITLLTHLGVCSAVSQVPLLPFSPGDVSSSTSRPPPRLPSSTFSGAASRLSKQHQMGTCMNSGRRDDELNHFREQANSRCYHPN